MSGAGSGSSGDSGAGSGSSSGAAPPPAPPNLVETVSALSRYFKFASDEHADLKRNFDDCTLIIANTRKMLKIEEDRLGSNARDKQLVAVARHALPIFRDSEHIRECKEAASFVDSLGGAQKVLQIKEQFERIQNGKVPVEQQDYEDILRGMSLFVGCLAILQWQDGGKSFVLPVEQRDVSSPSDISLEVVFRACPTHASVLTVNHATASKFLTAVTGLNAKQCFDEVASDDNLQKLFDGSSAGLRQRMGFSKFKQEVIMQSRRAIEQQSGLAHIFATGASSQAGSSNCPLKSLADAAISKAGQSDDDSDDAEIVEVRTREDRDRVGRANAIELE